MAVVPDDLYSADSRKTIDEFRRLKLDRGWTDNAAAKRVGCSPATLNRLLNLKYTGDVAQWATSMTRALRREQRRSALPDRPPFVQTTIAERVRRVLSLAQDERAMVLILGRSGVGKTFAAQQYIEHEPDALYLLAGPAATPHALLHYLAVRLGLGTCGTTYSVRSAIIGGLKGSDRFVIVDEADYIREPGLQALRIIHDEAHVGVALIGTMAYLQRLREKRSPTIDQVLSRIAYREYIREVPAADLKLIAAKQVSDKDALRALMDGACGSARRCTAAMVSARRIAKAAPITAAHVREAFQNLMPADFNGEGAE